MVVRSLTESTRVTFPRGDTTGQSSILLVAPIPASPGNVAIVAEETPFHPVDSTWPDQPGDVGTLETGGTQFAVIDTLTAALELGSAVLHFGAAIPARRGAPGWLFLVAHVVDIPTGVQIHELGGDVLLRVDPHRRARLSASHSACHLAALALNKASREYWRKVPRRDSLGNPDFDQLTIEESRITLTHSLDRYRLGKSIRKSGLDTASLRDNLPGLAASANAYLADWLSNDDSIWITSDAATLDAPRFWHCLLPDGEAVLPCGGTHLNSIRAFKDISVSFDDASDPNEIQMKTIRTLSSPTDTLIHDPSGAH